MARKYLKDNNEIVRAITSNNLQLEKPLLNENYDIEVHNRNMDKIDTAIQEVKGRVDGLELTAERVSIADSTNKFEATNVEDALLENKASILNLQNQINQTNSQLEQNANYQMQEDFVESLSKQMSVKKATVLCNDIESCNFSIFYDIKNDKAIRYFTAPQSQDDYSILQAGSIGDLSKAYVNIGSQKYSRKEGTFNENYTPNGYTVNVGDKLYWENISNVEGLSFYSFIDTRGGLWKFTLNTGETVTISRFGEQSGYNSVVLFSDLDKNAIYSLEAEFLGDDPKNPPSTGSGTSRGWYIFEVSGDAQFNSLLLCESTIGINNPENILQPYSNKDFAFHMRKKGSTYNHQFFPLHSGIQTSYKVEDFKIFLDGKDITSEISNRQQLEFKDKLIILQKVYCKIPDDIATDLGIMTSKIIFKSNGVVELLNNFKVLEDIEIKSGYVNMFPIDNTYCPIFKTSTGNKYDITKSAGYTNLKKEDEMSLSYIAGGGNNDICVAMTTINPLSTLRKGKQGRRDPLIWIEHRSATFQKLYPQVFENGEMLKGENYSFGCKFIICKSDGVDSLYLDV